MRAVTIYTTGRCNLRCKHCAVGADQESVRPELSTDETKRVLSRLAEGGARYVTLLGGEATVYRRDLDEILDYAEDLGLHMSINTNGTSFALLEPLLSRRALKSLVVSLDGASAMTHDALRGQGTFHKTVATLQRLGGAERVGQGEVRVELSFVLSALNHNEAGTIVGLAKSLGVQRLNVKHVKLIGRAEQHTAELGMSHRDLLKAYCMLILTWMVVGSIELDVHVPPALAHYLNRRFGLDYPVDDHPACGGIDEFGYVDLSGNYLPCPAMSYEENQATGIVGRHPDFSLLTNTTEEVREELLFRSFEQARRSRQYQTRMHPCRVCKFNDLSRPCTADLIKGSESGEVEICAALYAHGDEDLPGFREEVFST